MRGSWTTPEAARTWCTTYQTPPHRASRPHPVETSTHLNRPVMTGIAAVAAPTQRAARAATIRRTTLTLRAPRASVPTR